jgi:hypothetical protein
VRTRRRWGEVGFSRRASSTTYTITFPCENNPSPEAHAHSLIFYVDQDWEWCAGERTRKETA